MIDHDEFEQELLALIDRTEDDPDNKHLENSEKPINDCDAVLDNLTERRFKDYDVNLDMKNAFWRGFLQGLIRSEKVENKVVKRFVDLICRRKVAEELTKDPYLENNCHAKIIENNQDVTHKNLSDWEKTKSAALNIERPVSCDESIPDCDANTIFRAFVTKRDSATSPRISSDVTLPPDNTSNIVQKTKSDEKLPKHTLRSLLVLNKADIHFDPLSTDEKSSRQTQNTDKHKSMGHTSEVVEDTVFESSSTISVDEDTPGDLVENHGAVETSEEKLKTSEKLRDKISYISCLEDDVNIFQLAKKRMKNQELQNNYFTPLNHRSVTEKEEKRSIQKNTFTMEDFNAWSTKLRPFADQDTLRISTSEILHPVESDSPFEKCKLQNSTTNIRTETPSGLSKLSSSLKSKKYSDPSDLLKLKSKSAADSPFLSCETIDPNGKKFETNAFKAQGSKYNRNPFLNDIKNKADLVTIRLTKSTTSSPVMNHNVPISKSQSLHMHKKFLSSINATKRINLTESLAKQLKDIGKDKQKTSIDRESLSISGRMSSGLHHRKGHHGKGKQLKELDPQAASETKAHNLQPSEAKRFNETCLTLPKINESSFRRALSTTPTNLDECIPRLSEPIQLPPISGTSLLHNKHTLNEETKSEELSNRDQYELRSIQVRAGNCTSPFAFDKQDPAYLKVLPTPFSHKQVLCSTCGGIKEGNKSNNTERQETTADNGDSEERFPEVSNYHLDETNISEIHICSDVTDIKPVQRSWAHENLCKENQTNSCKKIGCKETNNGKNSHRGKDKQVNIVYKDENIKLRVKCEVKLSDRNAKKDTQSEDIKSYSKSKRRTDEMAVAKHREKLECPIMKETRIYSQKKKSKNDSEDNQKTRDDYSVCEFSSSSPYLEYCKRREQMRSNKQDFFHEDLASFLSDTCLADLAESVRKTKRQVLTVLPKKKSSDELKGRKIKRSKHRPCHPKKQDLISNDDTDNLIITPSSLPKLEKKDKNRH